MISDFNFKILLLAGILLCFSGCENLMNDPPQADFIASPGFGDVQTVFLFDAGISSDNETELWRLKVRWDAESDGVWDSDYSVEKKFAFQFSSNGVHSMTLEVLDSYGGSSQIKKTVLVAPVIVDSFMTDYRDHQVYKTVQLWGKWYMAENLKYGYLLDTMQFPSDNGLPEANLYLSDTSKAKLYGYFYTYNEATNYRENVVQGICPDGWHIMNIRELHELESILWKIQDKSDFLEDKGYLHLNIPRTGRYYYPSGDWNHQEFKGYFWITQEQRFEKFSTWVYYNGRDTICDRSESYSVSWTNHWKKEWGEFSYRKIALPVRCVKN